MPRSQKAPDAPKTPKADWTASKVRFVLNEYLTEKENGNMIGGNWKPCAYTNVLNRYNLAYPEEQLLRSQIKNMFTTNKGQYSGMKRVKCISGVGWVDGKIDMPNEWWENVGKKNKDALRLRNHAYPFFEEMDALLHSSRPAGALRTGTSSASRVKAKINKEEEIEMGSDEVDGEGLTQREKDLDDGILGKSDGEQIEEEHSTEEAKAMASDHSSLPTLESLIHKDADTTLINMSKSNQFDKDVDLKLKGPKSKKTQDFVCLDGTDSDDCKLSTAKKTVTVSKIKKKTPAREVKPGTLANAIASASKDSLVKAQAALDRDKLKDARSTELSLSIKEAARIKADKLPHLQKALDIFNLDSEKKISDINDRVMAINVISDEPKAAVFGGLDEKMRWVWLIAEVEAKKKTQNDQ